MRRTSAALLPLSLLLCFLFSCQNAIRNDAYYAAASQYVYAYTAGSVNRTEPVRVRFASAAITPEQIGQRVPSNVFSVSPAIEGDAIWEDDRTILLKPKAPLPCGQQYTGEVSLGRIWNEAPREVREFDFGFRVRDLSLDVTADGLRAEDPADLRRQQVTGVLRTNQTVDNAALEKVLNATQAGNSDLKITWSHTEGGLEHRFVVNGVSRSNNRSQVQLAWDANAVGLDQQGKTEVPVPSLGEFEAISARIEQAESQYLLVNFSDPVSPTQQLDGLVRVEGFDGKLRYALDGNSLRVYPSRRITGQHRLLVSEAVRNTAGAALSNTATWPLAFEEMKPQVRLVGRGAIIPGDDKGSVIFPFEAVGLNAVDVEVFKIYNSNILQYLQVNEIEGNNELYRVGKIILQKKISLTDLKPGASNQTWQRYALDLKEMIAKDPQAIYQVRLSFRKSYATNIACPADPGLKEPALPRLNDYGDMTSLWGSYRGIYWSGSLDGDDYGWDYDESYEYDNQENPCFREYYQSSVFDRRNVFVSDLGLTAKRGKDGSVFAAVTDLHTTAPVSGVNLEFYNFQLQPIGKVSTGRDGIATLDNLRDVPFLMVATQGGRRGYLRMAEGSTLSLSRFDVAGVETQKGLKGYLYGERGVWRPGDSIYLDFVLEDKTGKLPAGHPVNFQLSDPNGNLRHSAVVTQGVNGVYPLHCNTSPEAPTGNWTARVEVGGAKFTKTLKIETVKPNRLKLDLDFGKKFLTEEDNERTGTLSVNWLHGAIAKGLKAKVELQVRSAVTKFPNLRDFVFEDPARSFYSDPQVLFDGTLDDKGKAQVPLKINVEDAAPGKLIASFKIRAFENGGDFSTDNFSLDYYPFPRLVGLKMPDQVAVGKSGTVDVVCVDPTGKPLANRTIELGLYRCDWRWWWDEDRSSDVAQFNSTTHVNALDTKTVTTDANGRASWKVNPTEWGRYLVRAIDEEGGHAVGGFFWSGYPYNLNDLHSRNAVAMLPLTADKEKYNVGEDFTIKVPASNQGRILVTLENGSRVVQHLWFDAKAGDNLLKIKTTEEMAPAVYAHVSLIQPHAQTQNDLPIRMYGVVPINVENPATRLAPLIEMADALRPGESFSVKVREAKGMACAYTLAIVDEGLLDLTRFKTPNPWEEFFAREALGVQTWDVYDYVLGAYGVELERILSIGGDGINQKAKNAAQVNRFKPVVRHIGPFYLEKGKTASHNFKIDNYVGSVRVMAVLSDPKPNSKGAYGSAEKTVPVRKPLMILPTLPRVLGPGETLKLPVDVFAMEKQVKNATVRIRETSGLVTIQGSPTNSLTFSEPGEQMTYFTLKVGDHIGAAKFIFEAQGGGETATDEIEILVRNPMPVATSVVQGTVEPGKEWTAAYNSDQYAEINSAQLEVSALPPMNLSRHLGYLIRYPHGCLEQTTSAAFPQLYAGVIAPLTEKQKNDITRNVSRAIAKIQNQQDFSGGFSYWPGGPVNEWGTTYASHFLIEARSKGYAVPDNVLKNATEFLTRLSRAWQMPENNNDRWSYHDGQMQQAYRLYALSLAGQPDIADMNRLREAQNLYTEVAYLLASGYAAAGKPEVARELTKKSWRSDYVYDWCGYTYGSDLRDRALMLETYLAVGDQPRAEAMLNYLAQSLNDENEGAWYWNTQSLATALRAFSNYATKNAAGGPSYAYHLGGNSAQRGDASKPVSLTDLTANVSASKQVTVKNNGSVKLYTRFVLNGQQLPGADVVADASNLRLDIKYFGTDGKALNPARIAQGTDFVAEVSVTRQTKFTFSFNDLALTQIFPSGWEITNTRMGNFVAGANETQPNYQDFRDDRVLTYFDLNTGATTRTFRIQLNAAYAGRYFLPAVSCEGMYDSRLRALVPGAWVEVI